MRETQLRLMLRHEWQRSMRRWQPKWTALQTMLPRLRGLREAAAQTLEDALFAKDLELALVISWTRGLTERNPVNNRTHAERSVNCNPETLRLKG